jgi:large conductance mechanosensitive channel
MPFVMRLPLSVLKEFKEFAMKGNVLDMAVGVIIGGAFGKVVSSFLNDFLMPPLGLLMGSADFTDLALTLKPPLDGVKPVVIRYGAFITTVIDFLLVAFAVFLLVKAVNRLKRAEPTPPPTPLEKKCPECRLLIPLEANRCGHCAQPLGAPTL